jgi:hypothetical protein
MAAIDNTMISNILNATTPTGAAGIPGAFTVLAASAMKLRLNSTASTASAAGTEIVNGTGYAAGGFTSLGASTASSAGSAVGVPLTTQSATATSTWSIQSLDLTSSAAVRAWWGNFTGAPIAVAIGNTFQVTGGSGAAAGIQISLT